MSTTSRHGRGAMVMRGIRASMAAVLLLLGALAHAQTQTVSIYIDRDAGTGSGCVATVAGANSAPLPATVRMGIARLE